MGFSKVFIQSELSKVDTDRTVINIRFNLIDFMVEMAHRRLCNIWVTTAQLLVCFIAMFYTGSYYDTITKVAYTPRMKIKYSDKFLSRLFKDTKMKMARDSSNATGDVSDDTGTPSNQDSTETLMQDKSGPSKVSYGPIMRFQHLVPANKEKDNCKVFGEGLHRAKVGVVARLTIETNDSCTRGQELNKTSVFSVLGVGKNHIFVAHPTPRHKVGPYLDFSYLPTYPGEYDLYVEDVVFGGQWQVPGSPFRLKIDGVQEGESPAQARKLPPCQSLRLLRENLSWVKGGWVTRKLARRGEDVLRSGWVHQPKICNFDIFTKDDIHRAAISPTPTTIAVLGTSTERGIFLSLVDLTLKKEEKTDIRLSDLGRCWGFVELRIGNVTFIYQDFRINRANKTVVRDGKTIMVTCHNEKKADEGYKFWDDALAFLNGFLFGNRVWPDLVLLPLDNKLQLRLILKALPKSWNGTLYLLSGFKTYKSSQFTTGGRQLEIKRAKEYPTLDPRVQVLDAFTLSAGMRHATENSPLIMGSEHWHRWCNELDGEMKVCGITTEMIAQILLGKVIAPRGKDVWIKAIKSFENTSSPALRETYVCHDCPMTLLPFHIKRRPDLKCYKLTKGLRRRLDKNVRVWDGSLCPEECMKTTPVGKAYTQSGMVDVRYCNISI